MPVNVQRRSEEPGTRSPGTASLPPMLSTSEHDSTSKLKDEKSVNDNLKASSDAAPTIDETCVSITPKNLGNGATQSEPESTGDVKNSIANPHEHTVTVTAEPDAKKPPIQDQGHEEASHGHEQDGVSTPSEVRYGNRVSTLSTLFSDTVDDKKLVSEWSHQILAPKVDRDSSAGKPAGEEWQEMPAYAPYDMFNDDGKLIAREIVPEKDDNDFGYGNLGGVARGYTRVQVDEDAQSANSMDDNTAYLFKEKGTNVQDEDEDARNPLEQLQATRNLLTDGQKIAYVGLTRLAAGQMVKQADNINRTRKTKKELDTAVESLKMWSQKVMIRLYGHMEIKADEQIMIEQLIGHDVEASDLAPMLIQSVQIQNPMDDASDTVGIAKSLPVSGTTSRRPSAISVNEKQIIPGSDGSDPRHDSVAEGQDSEASNQPDAPMGPLEASTSPNLNIDIRWTVLCDLFLVLIADAIYDSRSRVLLELVGSFLDVSWLDICRFEKRVTDALELQAADKENWDEDEHLVTRAKLGKKRRIMMMGLATVGGGLVIGLSAGLLAPVIGAGLAAGFTTIGVAGTGGFLAGAGGAAMITSAAVVSGGTIAVRATGRRLDAVKTFEYRPLHNNKRVNLIVTVAGWMTGTIDDVRLPFSTVDPIMGDIYSIHWEPEMLQSMGNTINILATEALTQGLQQLLGSTILITLMASLQLPIVLTKLSYLIDNPWSSSQARADLAGLILADSLIDRNLGVRPVTLVGFSLGSRVIFECLKELAAKGAYGLVQNVYMFGSPVVLNTDQYLLCRSIVSGRFVNGYATNDWILGYLFRATGGGVMRVAGLAPVEVPGIENIDVTELVPGHMQYRQMMPRLLREVGWSVISDEFTEIEDPDPENHERRQRELINEIEEARKQLEKKSEKKRFKFFRTKKLEKKEWETYDEGSKGTEETENEPGEAKEQAVLFDVEAIRAELAGLAAEGFHIKELQSTLPPMRLNIDPVFPDSRKYSEASQASVNSLKSPVSPLNGTSASSISSTEAKTPPYRSLNASPRIEPQTLTNSRLEEVSNHNAKQNESTGKILLTVSVPLHNSSSDSFPPQKPVVASTSAPPLAITQLNVEHNAWADDDASQEQEVKMTFE